MDKLYIWSSKRAGGGISVTHSCGKITGVSEIAVEDGKVIARCGDGRRFELVVSATAVQTSVDLDRRTGRPFGDHGTGSDAVNWVLNHSGDNDFGNMEAFLKAWQEGGAFDEWPEFYAWLATRAASSTGDEQ